MKVEVKVFVAIYVLLISLRSISAQEIKPELVAQNGHTSDVTAVAYSGDGQRLASAGSDGTVRVWDVSSGNVLRTMSSEPGLFFTWIAFSFDGRRILSLNEKRLVAGMTIKLWDAVTGVELKTLSGEFTSAALDPTGKMIALGEDETVKLLDAETLRPIRELNGHKATIRSIAFSPDGKTVATASDDKTVNLWNSNTGMVTLSFPEQAEAVENVAFSPDSKRLVTSTNDDKLIKLWDVATGKLIQSFAGHISDIKTLSVSTDGKTIVSLGEVGDRRIRIWDVPGGRQIGQLPVDLLCAAISPDGSTIAAGGDDTASGFGV